MLGTEDKELLRLMIEHILAEISPKIIQVHANSCPSIKKIEEKLAFFKGAAASMSVVALIVSLTVGCIVIYKHFGG